MTSKLLTVDSSKARNRVQEKYIVYGVTVFSKVSVVSCRNQLFISLISPRIFRGDTAAELLAAWPAWPAAGGMMNLLNEYRLSRC